MGVGHSLFQSLPFVETYHRWSHVQLLYQSLRQRCAGAKIVSITCHHATTESHAQWNLFYCNLAFIWRILGPAWGIHLACLMPIVILLRVFYVFLIALVTPVGCCCCRWIKTDTAPKTQCPLSLTKAAAVACKDPGQWRSALALLDHCFQQRLVPNEILYEVAITSSQQSNYLRPAILLLESLSARTTSSLSAEKRLRSMDLMDVACAWFL